MNLVFRVVRRKSDGRKVVASELAKSAVGGLGSTLALMAALLSLSQARAELSDITAAAGSSGSVYVNAVNPTTNEKVTIIDIASPDATSKISHTTFNTLNVNSTGVIVNNIKLNEDVSSVLLDDTVSHNPHFGSTEADVILMEVTSSNASTFAGRLEILRSDTSGTVTDNSDPDNPVVYDLPKLTDVLIANPNGITVNGASFLNAGQVVLATGSASVSGTDVSFDLSSSAITVSDPSVSGTTSLNAGDLALISRQIDINGRIDANDLRVVAHNGTAKVNTTDGSISTSATGAESGSITGYAIDSAALGGMYANTITLIANESGTGVKVVGDMAALGDAISISADGELLVGDGSGTDLNARTIQLTGSAVSTNEANLQAEGVTSAGSSLGGSVQITSTSSDVTLVKGEVVATKSADGSGGDVTIKSANDFTDTTAPATGANTRTALGNFKLQVEGDVNVNNATYTASAFTVSDEAGTGSADTFTFGSTATLNTNEAVVVKTVNDLTINGELSLGNNSVTQTTSVFTSASGQLLVAAAAEVSADSLTLVGSTVTVLSDLSTQKDLVIGDSNSGVSVIGASGLEKLLSVGGTLVVKGEDIDIFSDLAITGTSTITGFGTSTVDVNSDSTITSNDTLTVSGDDLTVSGAIVQPGAVSFAAADTLSVTNTGSITTTDSADISLIADGLFTNDNVIKSSGDLTIGDGAAGSSFTNTGTVTAAGDIGIDVDGVIYNQAVLDSSDTDTQDGRNLGNLYDESLTTPASQTNDTVEDKLLVDAEQIGSISSTSGSITLTSSQTINEGEISANSTLDVTNTDFRNQLAGIYDGTSNAGDDRATLFSPLAKYDYVNTNDSNDPDAGGVESYANDQYLEVGRANFKPTVSASTLKLSSSADNLNIGGELVVNTQTGDIKDIDVSASRSVTTVITPEVTTSTTSELSPITPNGNTDTSVEIASNNATWVINIAQPNAAGLSNNTYSEFGITSTGAILNNMPFSQSVTAVTDLSAVITGNPTLTDPATVILNQVFSTGPSVLNGFLEVAGNSADVLLVNPAGIQCDACGVINVDRFDLVVGSVGLASDGSVDTLSSNTLAGPAAPGVFELLTDGIDSSTPTWTSIITPKAVIDASLNAKNLFLGLGGGTYQRNENPDTVNGEKFYSRSTESSSTASKSLFVTSQGGVFADTVEINSKASAGNPSLQIMGEIAANSGDLMINADGMVNVSGRISSSGDLTLNTTSSNDSKIVAAADIQLLNGAITSGGDMLLEADSGSIVFNGGQIYSFKNLKLDALTFVDEGTDNPAEFNNTRFAGGELRFAIDNEIVFNGTSWEADIFYIGNRVDEPDAGEPERKPELEIGEGTILKAISLMDMYLTSLDNAGTVASEDRIVITAANTVVNNAEGVITAENSSSLRALTLTNRGNWIASNSMAPVGGEAETNPPMRGVDWNVNNIYNETTGVIFAASTFDLEGATDGSSATKLVNRGEITSSASTNVKVTTVDNIGDFTVSLRDSGEDSTWIVSGLTNRSSGTLFAGDNWYVNATGSSSSSKITNYGVLQGYRNLTLDFGTLAIGASNDISGALKGESSDLFKLNISNEQNLLGLIYSNAKLDANFASNLYIDQNAAIIANGNSDITAANLTNYGFVYAGNDLTLSATGNIGNFATVKLDPYKTYLGTSTTANFPGVSFFEGEQTLVSFGDIRADSNVTISAGNTFVNSAEVRAGELLTVDASKVSNQVQNTDDGFNTDRPISKTYTGDTATGTNGSRLNFSIGNEISESCYKYPDDCNKESRTLSWEEFEYFTYGVPAKTPIMLAGTAFDIEATNDITNYGGLIQSTGSGASSIASTSGDVTNDALVTHKTSFTQVQEKQTTYIALGPLIYEDRSWDWRGETPTAGTPDPRGSGTESAAIKASGSLNITAEIVGNIGSPVASAVPSGTSALDPSGSLGITITLPQSPNGFFVTNRDPSAAYLVEMNPKLQPGISTLGSDYLLENLNINSDSTVKRLGDASYEAYLVEQQLIEQTGSGVLDGYNNIADVMSGFMNNAVSQAGTLGLVMGQPLTEEQLEALDEPIVWMVEVEIDGQKVLAPKVYLPKKIAEEIAGQTAVISADDLTMNVAGLDNIGGSIEAKNDLDITSTGDINNISGSISGNNVSLESTEGNINNETFNQYSGNDLSGQTVIGKTAGISANNDLNLKAAGDITNLGAEMNAGNNANLDAGGDITFDTIEDVSRTYELSGGVGVDGNLDLENPLESSVGLSSSYSETRTKTTKQIKSGLNVGGNLSTKSGGDTTFAGTDVNVGGDADIQSDGAINIIARENSTETSTKSQTNTIGLGTELMSSTTTQTDSLSIRNVGSTFNVGGNANFSAEEDMTIQGSDLQVGGDATIDAESLNVLAGRDLDQSTSTTEKTSIGIKVEKMENVDGSESEGVTFGENVKETEERLSLRSQGSTLGIGGNLTVNVEKDVTLQGSEVEAGGDVDIEAENIRMLAAQNIERVKKTTETVKMGLYASAEAEGEAGTETNAEAGADASTDSTSTAQTANANAGAGASAGASASGSASATLDFAVGRTDDELSLDITNTGSLIKSGGNLKLKAKETIELEGSEVVAQGDVDVKATDIISRAAEDISIREKTSESTRVGLYAEAGGEAEASAEAGANAEANGAAGITGQSNEASAEAKAGVSAEAGGKAGIGLQTQVASLTEKDTTITSQVSAIRSLGGSVTREAENKIVDIGTELEAAQNFTQSAKEIESLAARNESISERSYSEVTAKAGIYAEAEGEASAEAGAAASADTGGAGAEAGAQASAEGGARVGVEVQVDTLDQKERQRNTEAVVSTIKVGGDFSSTSQNASTFEGTEIEAGGDLTVEGEDINILAARNTSESEFSQTSTSSRVAVAVGVGGSAEAGASVNSDGEAEAGAEAEGGVKVRAEVQTNVATEDEKTTETEAVTASFKSGGSMNLNAENDINIEGADLEAEEINVDARELNFQAAENTSETTSSSTEVDVDVTVEATIIGSTGVEGEVGVGVGVENSSESSSEAVTGSITANNLNIKTREDANFEGTQVTATESANLDVGGDLNVTAARNTEQSSSDSVNVEANVNASSGGDFGADVGVEVSNANAQSSEAVTGAFNVGNLNLKTGGDANFEGTTIDATGDANLDIGGDLDFKAARNTSSSDSLDVSVEVGVGTSSSEEDDGSSERSGSFEAGVGVAVSKSDSSEAVTGLLGAGGKLNIKTGGDATFEGTDIAGGDGVDLEAGGNVAFNEAVSTSSSLDVGVGVGVGMEKSSEVDGESGDRTDSSAQSLSMEMELGLESSAQGKGSSISGGSGGINIKSGGNVELTGTEFDSNANIDAEGKVIKKELTDESSSFNMEFAAEAEFEQESETPGSNSEGDDSADGTDNKDEADKADSDKSDANEDSSDTNDLNQRDTDEEPLKESQDDPTRPGDSASDTQDDPAADDDGEAMRNLFDEEAAANESTDNKDANTDTEADAEKKAEDAPADAAEEEEEGDGPPEIDLFADEEEDGGEEDGGDEEGGEDAPDAEQPVAEPQSLEIADGRVQVPGLSEVADVNDVQLTDANGESLPDWVSLDIETGELAVDAPADFTGDLGISIELPDGQTFEVQFSQ